MTLLGTGFPEPYKHTVFPVIPAITTQGSYACILEAENIPLVALWTGAGEPTLAEKYPRD
jgi:hypothetical protein